MAQSSTDLSKDLSKRLDELSSKVSRMAGETFGSAASDLADSAHEYMDTATKYVEENPARSLAFATAVGMIVGVVLTLFMGSKE